MRKNSGIDLSKIKEGSLCPLPADLWPRKGEKSNEFLF